MKQTPEYVIIKKARGPKGTYREVVTEALPFDHACDQCTNMNVTQMTDAIIEFYVAPYNNVGIGGDYYATNAAAKTVAFKFVGVDDLGPMPNGGCCPHCGSEGRYIYNWTEDGVARRAMSGCYALLTGKLQKDSVSKYMELLAEKQAKNKPLNGWDKTVVRMLKYQQDNASDAGKIQWAANKIQNTLSKRQATLTKSGRFNGR